MLAAEPHLLDGSVESYRDLLSRGLSQHDAEALTALASHHCRHLPISGGQLMDDLRQEGIEPNEPNLSAFARVAAAAYRNANIQACSELGSSLGEGEIWPLPPHLERLAEEQDA